MASGKRGRIWLTYVLGQFPSPTETFILREITTLEAMGFAIVPLSLQPAPPGPYHAQAEPFLRRTLYRPRPLSWQTWGSLIRAFFQRPVGFTASLWLLASLALAHPIHIRELVSAFLAAAYFASRLPAWQARHIHAHFASFPATVGLFLREICNSSFSLSCHARDIFTGETILAARKFREADFVIVCTRYGLERLQRNHSLILADKLHLVRHGIEVERLRQERHIEYPVPLIISVGRLVEKKGFPFLLQAAALLQSRGLSFELVIVGEGPLRDELERLAGGLGLRERVVFAGYLTQEQLAHVYRRASVFCLASVVAPDGDRDGLPNTILEAMAFGVPVVASRVGAIPEAVRDGETGLLAAPGAPEELAGQLERALTDLALRERLIANARRLVAEEFDLEKNTLMLARLFAQSLELKYWPAALTAPAQGESQM